MIITGLSQYYSYKRQVKGLQVSVCGQNPLLWANSKSLIHEGAVYGLWVASNSPLRVFGDFRQASLLV